MREEEPEFTITVYRDHPDWAACSQWFLMRMDLLRELYVATYDVPVDPEDGLPVNMKATARWVRKPTRAASWSTSTSERKWAGRSQPARPE
jgi:hypothetical protein